MLYPAMLGEVLAFHDRLTLWVGAGVPVPVDKSVVVEGCALLVNVRVALSAPATSGLKVTVNGTLCPAGIVTGRDRPPITNSELFVLAAVTVTLTPLAFRLPELLSRLFRRQRCPPRWLLVWLSTVRPQSNPYPSEELSEWG